MMKTKEITRVTYRWDAPAGVEPAWYAEAYAGNSMVCDSQKIWFPVDVSEFGEDNSQELEVELKQAFPNAEVIQSGIRGC